MPKLFIKAKVRNPTIDENENVLVFFQISKNFAEILRNIMLGVVFQTNFVILRQTSLT